MTAHPVYRREFLRQAARWLLLGLGFSGLYALLAWQLNSHTGLTQTFFQGVGGDRAMLLQRLTRGIDLSILEEHETLPRRFFSIRWNGVWHVSTGGVYDIHLAADDLAVLRIDEQVVHEHVVAGGGHNPRTVFLEPGFHTIEIDFEQYGGTSSLQVSWAPPGGVPRPLNPEHLLPERPTHPRLRGVLEIGRRTLRLVGLTVLAISLCVILLALVKRARRRLGRTEERPAFRTIGRLFPVVLPVLVVTYGATLRFDAITIKYGSVESPKWLQSLQERSRAPLRLLRPSDVSWDVVPFYPHRDGQWTHYISDPYTYLGFAREMRSFYGAHYREPLFPFVTKMFLRVLDDQDVAVSFASALFSILTVLATYLLGSYAFSRWVGLGAALAMAIEYDVISWGVGGWRDDAFAFWVVMFAYTMLRQYRTPSNTNALLMGVCGGAACLVRITAVSFVLPGFGWLLLMSSCPWKMRLTTAGVGVLTMTAIVAPYLVNCWRAYGDPLYAINYHTAVYLTTEGQVVESGPTATAYVGARVVSDPMRTLRTVALGLTSHPFTNKWRGFGQWVPSLGRWLSWGSLLGLALSVGSGTGRLLLVVLVASLVPFAVTWELISDWRFTQHAYPFFLVAAFVGIGRVASWAAAARIGELLTERGPRLRRVLARTVVVAGLGAGAWAVLQALPILAVRRALLAGEAVPIMAGVRDTWFFRGGWSAPLTEGNVTTRVSRDLRGEVWIPLPRVDDYRLTFRLDPFPRPVAASPEYLPAVRAFVNGVFVQSVQLHWNPERVGSYDVPLPRSVVKKGFNRLTLTIDPGAAGSAKPGISDGAAFKLWYVLVRPAAVASR